MRSPAASTANAAAGMFDDHDHSIEFLIGNRECVQIGSEELHQICAFAAIFYELASG